ELGPEPVDGRGYEDGASRSPPRPGSLLLLLSGCDDVDDLAAALGAELDGARLESEQRVVAATADARAGVEVGAALTDEDLAGADGLTAEALHAESLCVGVT